MILSTACIPFAIDQYNHKISHRPMQISMGITAKALSTGIGQQSLAQQATILGGQP
jgi:hypothetical protein